MKNWEEWNGLKVGQRIKHNRIVLKGKDRKKEIRVHNGTVTDLYEHIFRVKWDDRRWQECFPYSMLESTAGEWIRPL